MTSKKKTLACNGSISGGDVKLVAGRHHRVEFTRQQHKTVVQDSGARQQHKNVAHDSSTRGWHKRAAHEELSGWRRMEEKGDGESAEV